MNPVSKGEDMNKYGTRIAIVCGASGGHIFPGIALARELKKRKDTDILVVATSKPLDAEILGTAGLEFAVIPYNPFVFTANPFKLAGFLARLAGGIGRGIKILHRFRPQCVAAFGGFVSGPMIIAAFIMRIPRIIHEQNAVAGLANRIGSRFADKVAVSFRDTGKFFNEKKVVLTGNPVNRASSGIDRPRARESFGLDEKRFTLFVIGGSQGSAALNRVLPEALGNLSHSEKKAFQVLHVAGKDDHEAVARKYRKGKVRSRVFSFLDGMERAYTASDLVISRSGASTIAELAYFGRPSILVPYPAKRVHQKENAMVFSERKAAVMLEENIFCAEVVMKLILKLKSNTAGLEEMAAAAKSIGSPEAPRLLAEEVISLAGKRSC